MIVLYIKRKRISIIIFSLIISTLKNNIIIITVFQWFNAGIVSGYMLYLYNYMDKGEIYMPGQYSNYDFEETMVTLTDEDGNDKDFYIDERYEVDNQLYAAAIPAGVDNITEYYVFRLKDLGNDDFEMEDITDEEEYDAAADAYEEKLDARLWNKLNENENI